MRVLLIAGKVGMMLTIVFVLLAVIVPSILLFVRGGDSYSCHASPAFKMVDEILARRGICRGHRTCSEEDSVAIYWAGFPKVKSGCSISIYGTS
jgi:hypothetical protein